MKPSAEIQRWEEAADHLAFAKAQELAMRLALIDKHFRFQNPVEGTVTVDVGAGCTLAAVFKTNYRLPEESATRAVLAKMAAADPAGAELVKRLVKFTPEIRVGELKMLPAKLAKLIAPILATSPATPTLELRKPK